MQFNHKLLLLLAIPLLCSFLGCGTETGNRSSDTAADSADTGATDNAADGTDGNTATDATDGTAADDGTDSTDSTGTTGSDAEDGTDGTTATDGADGTDTEDGTDGGTGSNGADGGDGADGSAGMDSGNFSKFPNAELLVKIVGPPQQNTGAEHVAVLSAVTPLQGIVFGNPDKVVWESSTGEKGVACGEGSEPENPCSAFWQTLGIPLDPVPAVNIVTVTAVKGDKEMSDDIRILYTPQFLFDTNPSVLPDALFVNETTKGIASVPITVYDGGIQKNTVKIWQVDKDGNKQGAAPLSSMNDEGINKNPCDEIEGDGVYSTCLNNLKCTNENEDLWLAVTVQVKNDFANYEAMSAPQRIECAKRIPVSECSSAHGLLKEAKNKWTSSGDQDPKAARDAAIEWLKTQDAVADAGPATQDGNGAWVHFKAGFLGALNFNGPEYRGGSAIARQTAQLMSQYSQTEGGNQFNTHSIRSKKALVMAPFWNEFSNHPEGDEAPKIANLLNDSECPAFSVDGALTNAQTTLMAMRNQYLYGVVALTTHGDAYFESLHPTVKEKMDWDHQGSQEVLWSGENVNCSAMSSSNSTCNHELAPGDPCPAGKSCCPSGQECVITGAQGTQLSGVCLDRTQIDLRKGRVILGAERWGTAPTLVSRYSKIRFPNSLVYLGACRTLYNGSLAAEYMAAGAKAVAGYSDYVHSDFASTTGTTFFTNMLEEADLTGQSYFKIDSIDADHQSAMFRLFGANNLNIVNSDLINPSFETSDLTGWTKDGDGRVIAQLGISTPVHGKFMGLVSTGLGFTVQTGEIKQQFCIPSDKSTMQFYWKFFSEEFKEWCGSQFQDTFQTTLKSANGQITVVNSKVDDLCHYNDGQCKKCDDPGIGNCECGSQYVGLVPSDVSFDQGGVYNVQWQLAEKDISPLAGAGPVELKFFSTDQGDSIYDTVILIDALVFK